ncbi:MAG: CPBP family glutamic-type intramembrane protease [Candidatus Neomarinimicrobiota bacterium]
MTTERTYWNQSRSPFYSFIFILPLILIYETGILLLSAEDMPDLRNGADVLMRQIFGNFGMLGAYGIGLLFMTGFIFTFLLQKRRWAITNIRSGYLLAMLAESLAWGGILFIILRGAQTLLLFSNGKTLIQQLILAVGAGIYEEFVFRVLLISGLAALLKLIFQWTGPVRNTGAVILAALLFSVFHFIGSFGDSFALRLLLVRALAGIILGLIYVLRGFGIAAYSHAFYDLIVLTLITTTD